MQSNRRSSQRRRPTGAKRRAALTKRAAAARRALSGRATTRRSLTAYRKLDFSSQRLLQRSLSGTRSLAKHLTAMMDAAHAHSARRGVALARALLTRDQTGRELCDTAIGLTRWGAAPGPEGAARRRSVCRTFSAAKADLLAVHAISQLSREDAREHMKTYIAEGGDLRAVAEWLQLAGKALGDQELAAATGTSRRKPSRRAAANRKLKFGLGSVVNAVGGAISDAAGAVAGAVSGAAGAVSDAASTVVDAVVSAGKSVGEAVAAAANWPVDKVTDVVKAVIRAGRRVGEILDEALRKNVVRKFVQALLRAGRSVTEVLEWAAYKAAAAVQACVGGLLDAGRTVLEVLSWAAGRAVDAGTRVVLALAQFGRNVATLMAAATRLAATALRRVVGMIFRAVGKLGEILAAVARCAVSVIRTVIEGLMLIGVNLVRMVAAICGDVAEGFRKGFFQGLIALGHAMLDILKAAVATSLSVLALAVAVFFEIWGGHRPLTAAERAEARRVFGWSFDLDRVKVAVGSIPADVVNWLNGQRPFTTMYVINFASWAHVTLQTLIHELTHVWQAAVSGPIYMVEALHSQVFGRGYNVTAQDVAGANGDIRRLEREQQAVVVEEYWRMRWDDGGTSLSWVPVDAQGKCDWTVLEPLAQDVYAPQPRVTAPIRPPIPSIPLLRWRRAAVRPLALVEDV